MLMFLLAFVLTIQAVPVSLQTSMVPENASWLLHFDMKQFASSRLCDLLKNDQSTRFSKYNQQFSEKLKMNLLDDITGVTVFGLGKDRHDTVVCLSGNLNKEYLLSLLDKEEGYQKTVYGKYTIHKWHPSQFGTFASNNLVLVARDEDAIKHVLDVITGKMKNITASAMMPLLREIPDNAFLGAATTNISALARDHDASMILKKTGMAFFIALEKDENIKLKLKLSTDSPETAQNIEQIVRGFIALAKMKQREKDSRLKLLENLTIKLAGNIVYLELSHPSKELADILAHH